MPPSHWALIGVLAVAAYAIRLTGLFAGNVIRRSKFAPLLDELPGLIIVSLVAASLAGKPAPAWFAGVAALVVAWKTNHVIATMLIGVAVYSGMVAVGL
jgi:uncharacterized membrane protein